MNKYWISSTVDDSGASKHTVYDQTLLWTILLIEHVILVTGNRLVESVEARIAMSKRMQITLINLGNVYIVPLFNSNILPCLKISQQRIMTQIHMISKRSFTKKERTKHQVLSTSKRLAYCILYLFKLQCKPSKRKYPDESKAHKFRSLIALKYQPRCRPSAWAALIIML